MKRAPVTSETPRWPAWGYLAALLASLAVVFMPHLCDEMHAEFLALSAPAAGLAWLLALTVPMRKAGERVGSCAVLVVTSLVLVMNVGSVVIHAR